MQLIKDNGNKRRYRLSDEREVCIDIDDISGLIKVSTVDGKEIGRVDLSEIDVEYSENTIYKLMWIYLDKLNGAYLRKGIGRECLIFFKAFTGAIICASENDGMKRDDGSHLTGDAPAFVQKMQKEGIIVSSITCNNE